MYHQSYRIYPLSPSTHQLASEHLIIIASIRNNIIPNPMHPILLDSFVYSPLKTSYNQILKRPAAINKPKITTKTKVIIVVSPVLFNSSQAYSSPLANTGIEIIVRSNNKYSFFIIIN